MTSQADQAAGAQPSRPGTPRVQIASVEPRILGVLSPVSAVALGIGALIGGVALLASGSGLGGAVLIAIAICLLALAIRAAREWPASRLPRATAGAAEAVGARLGLARASAGAWSHASREKARLEQEIRALRDERRSFQAELGEAAYREQPGRMDRLRRRLSATDRRIEERRSEVQEVEGRARERIEREQAASPRTQPFAIAEVPPPPTEDDDTRTTPTVERRTT